MHKVLTINLNGRAFQLDDDAYEALHAYLQQADAQLRDNPDRAEIVADLEQAIADKCDRYLGPQKTVVTLGEVTQILIEMGPVDAGAATDTGQPAGPQTTANGPKADTTHRLYRIKEGSVIGGVCTGLAAYFNLDAAMLRAGFVLIAVIDLGFLHTPIAVLIYVALMLLLPAAETSEEQAEARGMPFNAQELVDRARKIRFELRDKKWKHQARKWRRQNREWKRKWAQRNRAVGWSEPSIAAPSYGSRVAAGMTLPVLTAMNAIVGWGGILVILSFIRTGRVLGVQVPDSVPFWLVIIGLFVMGAGIGQPIDAARKASYNLLGGRHSAWFAGWDGILNFGFSVVVIWFAYRYVPDIRDALQHLPEVWQTFRSSFGR